MNSGSKAPQRGACSTDAGAEPISGKDNSSGSEAEQSDSGSDPGSEASDDEEDAQEAAAGEQDVDDQSDSAADEVDQAQLRMYERSKLRYYYAVRPALQDTSAWFMPCAWCAWWQIALLRRAGLCLHWSIE